MTEVSLQWFFLCMVFTSLLSCRSQVCSSFCTTTCVILLTQAREDFAISRLCHSPLSVPRVLFYSLQWRTECPDSLAYLWRRVAESHGFYVLWKVVEWSYHCLELSLHVPMDLCILHPPALESLETMRSALGQLFWYAKQQCQESHFQ